MNPFINSAGKLDLTMEIPGDRLISRAALLVAALAQGETEIEGLSNHAQIVGLISGLNAAGAKIEEKDGKTIVSGGTKSILEFLPPEKERDGGERLLAGLFAETETVIESGLSEPDHVQIMLRHFGIKLEKTGRGLKLEPRSVIKARKVMIPGDISHAAYFMAAGLIIKDSRVLILNAGINFTRTGIITAFRDMGGHAAVLNKRVMCGESVAEVETRTSSLFGTEISAALAKRAVGGLAPLAVCACFADGVTKIDYSQTAECVPPALIKGLLEMGAKIKETENEIIIEGAALKAVEIDAEGDEAAALGLALAAAGCQGL